MTPDSLLSCIPVNAFLLEMPTEQPTQFVIGTVIVAGIEPDLAPDVVVLEHIPKKLPLLISTMTAGPIETWQLGQGKQRLQGVLRVRIHKFDTDPEEAFMIRCGPHIS
ncbi:hypothetical protein HIM_12295 [Hirsutella minnesotensis 3608]|uniref:Uncharacterized protein n=1 Tax=Hirsutella minnesotensis 3608 TaxID=1043627 RepID=A0A0F8A088_9HYPO|nr:hypothetical protein HIM_12295 [Hirsutella minnesotensis 3608]